MKNLLKKIFVAIAVVLSTSVTVSLVSPQTVNAECRDFLGMVSWDCNTNLGPNSQPTESDIKSGIWTIVANVVTDITVIAAYLVVGYVIYGGYLYIFSGGEPGKVAAGKKALTQAFIGLAIILSASAILGGIRAALGVNFTNHNCVTKSCIEPAKIITNSLKWIIGIAGAVSAIFVVYGGISYTTSAGDPSKLQKAKNIITYALIGLAIVALSELIVTFVANMISNANAYLDQTTIAKEVHENQIH